MSQFSDERGAELRELFFETAQEMLQLLNEDALKLEKQPGDVETVRSIRRIVHTLKGDAAAVGFRELSKLAHALEDALALETAGAHASLAEIAFKAADTFGAMLNSYRRQAELPATEPLRKMIRELAKEPKDSKPRKTRAKKAAAASATAIVWTEYEKLGMDKARKQGKQVFHITAQVDPHCAMPIAARQLVLNALGTVGDVLGSRPETGSAEVSQQIHLLLASDKTGAILTAKCRIPTIISKAEVEALDAAPGVAPILTQATETAVAIEDAASAEAEESFLPVAQSHEIAATEPEASPKPVAAHAENILRVDAERIDSVLNLVGELIIGKSMLQQALNEFSKLHPKEAVRGRFADAMAFQARVLNDLQRSVMKVRMVPVEQLFRRFPRMVRDVSRQCGKQVELVLNGQETDLDKTLLDGIAEPMTHLVRNAIGHGIENPEERVRNGKPAHGTIRLDAYHQGNQVVIELSDDGRGIDAQKVKDKAIERGLVSPEHAKRLSEADVMEFIFQPGFSTADEITEVSGRGVGLDVVQSVLHRLKGAVQIETHPGKGTTFRLQLPLTLAIIRALLFRVERRLYAIPLNAVAEIARAYESDLHRVDNCEVLQLRGRALPILRLGRPAAELPNHGREKIFVLVMTFGERKLGLLVNALEGEEELVIKALDDQTVDTELVSGASILGDGRVVLILNLASIVERFSKSRSEALSGASSGLLLSQSERVRAYQNPAGVGL